MQLLNKEGVSAAGAVPDIAFESSRKTHNCKFNRDMCLEFAIGSIGKVLGPQFADIDRHPTRVRLPDQPLMLVDRIIDVEGEPNAILRDLLFMAV